MTADRVARRLVQSSKAPANKHFSRRINRMYKAIRKTTPRLSNISRQFTVVDINDAIISVKNGKASGFDGMYPEFLTFSGPRTRLWLARFFTNVTSTNRLPAAFKKTKIIALLKPNKPEDRPDSYRPIALLSVVYKFLERLLYNRFESEIDKLIQPEQAGFRRNRSCAEQVLSLTNHIESGFQRKLKTGVVFIDLSAAYDTVWKKGLLFKFIKAIPCLQMCDLINNMLSDRLFMVLLNDQRSRIKKLNNGLAQGSVLSCLLFNLYIHDLPPSKSRKFLYADDKAYAYQHKSFETINRILSKDMYDFVRYCKNWRLVPNASKTVSSCFHLTNQAANVKLEVNFNGVTLRHESEPVYLGVKLDRSLTYRPHMEKLKPKIATRNNLLQRLAYTSWGASAACLRTTALALVYSVAEYCCATWLNSAHVTKIDTELNRSMRIISGTVKSTPLEWLPALCNIAPSHIRRQCALLGLHRKVSSDRRIPLHHDLLVDIPSRLTSRRPPLITGKNLHSNNFDPKAAWNEIWLDSGADSRLFDFNQHSSKSIEFKLPRKIWCNLNRLRTGHGCCNELLYKWKFITDPSCSCGNPHQTMEHLLYECSIFKYEGDVGDFINLTDQALRWLSVLTF